MITNTSILSKKFLYDDFLLLTIRAGMGTRNKYYSVYAPNVKDQERTPIRNTIRKELQAIGNQEEYINGTISHEEHIRQIEDFSNKISEKYKDSLHNGRLRIGVSQKLINLYLKYLWCAGFIKEPPHCPIDGIVRDIAKKDIAEFDYNWTSSDDIEEYTKAIKDLIKQYEPQSLSEWELSEYDQQR